MTVKLVSPVRVGEHKKEQSFSELLYVLPQQFRTPVTTPLRQMQAEATPRQKRALKKSDTKRND